MESKRGRSCNLPENLILAISNGLGAGYFIPSRSSPAVYLANRGNAWDGFTIIEGATINGQGAIPIFTKFCTDHSL